MTRGGFLITVVTFVFSQTAYVLAQDSPDEIPKSFGSNGLWGVSWTALFVAFAAVFGGFLAKKAVSVLLGRAAKVFRKTRFDFDHIILEALIAPVSWGCVVSGLYIALSLLPLPSAPFDFSNLLNHLVMTSSIILMM